MAENIADVGSTSLSVGSYDLTMIPHFIVMKDVNVWQIALTKRELSIAKMGLKYQVHSSKLISRYSMKFNEYGLNTIKLIAEVGLNITKRAESYNSFSTAPHYANVPICPLGSYHSSYKCNFNTRGLYTNTMIPIFSFDASYEQSVLNKAIDFWIYIRDAKISSHILIIRDTIVAPINESLQEDLMTEKNPGIYVKYNPVFMVDEVIKHEIKITPYVLNATESIANYPTAVPINGMWIHFVFLSICKELTGEIYVAKVLMHTDTDTIVGNYDLYWMTDINEIMNKLDFSIFTMFINPRRMFYREIKIREMAPNFMPTISLLKAEAHMRIEKGLLVYYPFDDGYGINLRNINGVPLTLSFENNADFGFWIELPSLLVICDWAHVYSQKMAKCITRNVINSNEIISNSNIGSTLELFPSNQLSCDSLLICGQNLMVSFWFKHSTSNSYCQNPAEASLFTIKYIDFPSLGKTNIILEFTCKTNITKQYFYAKIPTSVIQYDTSLYFSESFDTSKWNHVLIRGGNVASDKIIYLNGVGLGNFGPSISLNEELTSIEVVTPPDLFYKNLIIKMGSEFPLSYVTPFEAKHLDFSYNSELIYLSLENDNDITTNIYEYTLQTISLQEWLIGAVREEYFSYLDYGLYQFTDQHYLKHDSYVKFAVNDTITVNPVFTVELAIPPDNFSFDMWVCIDGSMSVNFFGNDTFILFNSITNVNSFYLSNQNIGIWEAGKWYHYQLAIAETNVTMYESGKYLTQLTDVELLRGKNIILKFLDASNYRIKEIRLFNSTLSNIELYYYHHQRIRRSNPLLLAGVNIEGSNMLSYRLCGQEELIYSINMPSANYKTEIENIMYDMTMYLCYDGTYFDGLQCTASFATQFIAIDNDRTYGINVDLDSETISLSWTIESWVYFNHTEAFIDVIVGAFVGSYTLLGIKLTINDTVKATLEYYSISDSFEVPYTQNKWGHIALVTYSKSNRYIHTLFLNGEVISSQIAILPLSIYSFSHYVIGNSTDYGHNLFLKEMRVWSYPLSNNRIKSFTYSKYTLPQEMLMFYFPLDAESEKDSTGNAKWSYSTLKYIDRALNYKTPKVKNLIDIGPLALCNEGAYWDFEDLKCVKMLEWSRERIVILKNNSLTVNETNLTAVDWTIELWVNILRSQGADCRIFAHDVCSNSLLFSKSNEAMATLKYLLYPSNNISIESRLTVWTHYSFTYDMSKANLKAYINGVVAPNYQNGINIKIPMLEGCRLLFGEYNSTNEIELKITEFRIWSIARTRINILANMYKRIYGDNRDIMLYLRLNEGSGQDIYDFSTESHSVIGNFSNSSLNMWAEENEIKLCNAYMQYSSFKHSCVLPKQFYADAPISVIHNSVDWALSKQFTFSVWIKIIYNEKSVTKYDIIDLFNNSIQIKYSFPISDLKPTHSIYSEGTLISSIADTDTQAQWALLSISLITSTITKSYSSITSYDQISTNSFILSNIPDFTLYGNTINIHSDDVATCPVIYLFDLRIYNRYIPQPIITLILFNNENYYKENLIAQFKLDVSEENEIFDVISANTVSYAKWKEQPLFINNDEHRMIFLSNITKGIEILDPGLIDHDYEEIPIPEVKQGVFSIIIWIRLIEYNVSANDYYLLEFTQLHNPVWRTDFDLIIGYNNPSIVINAWVCKNFAVNDSSGFKFHYQTNSIIQGNWVQVAITYSVKDSDPIISYIDTVKNSSFTMPSLAVPLDPIDPTLRFYKFNNNIGVGTYIKYHFNKLQLYSCVLSQQYIHNHFNAEPSLLNPSLIFYLTTYLNFIEPIHYRRYTQIVDGKPYSTYDSDSGETELVLESTNFIAVNSLMAHEYCDSESIYNSNKCNLLNKNIRWVKDMSHSIELSIAQPSQDFTLELWIFPLQSNAGEISDIIYSTGNGTKIQIIYKDTSHFIIKLIISSLGVSISTDALLAADTWHHVAVSYCYQSTTSIEIQALLHINRGILSVNGMQTNIFPIPQIISQPILSDKLIVGSESYSGYIAHIRLWNIYRSSGKIGEDMHSLIEHEQYLTNYYPLNDGVGHQVRDWANQVYLQVNIPEQFHSMWSECPKKLQMCAIAYDYALDNCKISQQHEISLESDITLSTSERFALKEWSVLFWGFYDQSVETMIDFSTECLKSIINYVVVSDHFEIKVCKYSVYNQSLAASESGWIGVRVGLSLNLGQYYLKLVFADFTQSVPLLSSNLIPPSSLEDYTCFGKVFVKLSSNSKARKISIWNKYIFAMNDAADDANFIGFNFSPYHHSSLIFYAPLDESSGPYIHDISKFGNSTFFSTLEWAEPASENIMVDWHCNDPSMYPIAYNATFRQCNYIYYFDSYTCTNTQYIANDEELFSTVMVTNSFCFQCSDGYLLQGRCYSVAACVTHDLFENTCMLPVESVIISPTPLKCLPGSINDGTLCKYDCAADKYFIHGAANSTCKSCEDVNCEECIQELNGIPICIQCKEGYLPVKESDRTFVNSCYNASECANTSGILKPYMECFDGNTENNDGCSSNCRLEGNYFNCVDGAIKTACTPVVGDGFLAKGEVCDYSPLFDNSALSNCDCSSGTCMVINDARTCEWIWDDESVGHSLCFKGPAIQSVYYEDSTYSTIVVKYNESIHLLFYYSNSDELCKLLFDRLSYDILGDDPQCSLYSQRITIALGNGNRILSNTILNYSNAPLITSMSVQTLNPLIRVASSINLPIIPPIVVKSIISYPSTASSCSNLDIYAYNVTGLVNKPIKEIFLACKFVLEGANETFIVPFAEHSSSTYIATINKVSLVAYTEYNCQFTLSNYLENSYTQNFTIYTKDDLIPLITFDESDDYNRVAYAQYPINIRPQAKLYSCISNAVIYFPVRWKLIYTDDSTNGKANPLSNTQLLNFPPYALNPGKTYTYQAYGTYNGTNYSQNINVTVAYDHLLAIVDQGSRLELGCSENVTLTSSKSYDLSTNSNQSMTFKWNCKQNDMISQCPNYQSSILANFFTIDGSKFTIGTILYVQLIAMKDSRESSTYIEIIIGESPLTLSASIIDISNSLKLKRRIDEEYAFEAVVTGKNFDNVTYKWSMVGNPVINSFSKYITIPSYSMNYSTNYTLLLRATDASSNLTCKIGLNITTGTPPYNGTMDISPAEGLAYESIFTIQSNNWIGDGNQLFYSYSIRKYKADQYTYILYKSTSNQLTTILPEGNLYEQNLLTIRVEAEDSMGIKAEITKYIRVNPSNLTSLQKYAIIMSSTFDDAQLIKNNIMMLSYLIKQPSQNTTDVCGGCSGNGVCDNYTCKCFNNYKAMRDCSLSDEEASEEQALTNLIINSIIKVGQANSITTLSDDVNIIRLIHTILKKELIDHGKEKIYSILRNVSSREYNRLLNNAETLDDTGMQYILNLLENIYAENQPIDLLRTHSQIITTFSLSKAVRLMPGVTNFSINTKPSSYSTIKIRSDNVGAMALQIGNSSIQFNPLNILNIATSFDSPIPLISSVYILSAQFYNTPLYNLTIGNTSIQSGFLSIILKEYRANTLTDINNINDSIMLKIPYNTSYIDANRIGYYRCYYYDTVTMNMSDAGLKYVAADILDKTITCSTSHLSDFAIGIRDPLMEGKPIPGNISLQEPCKNAYVKYPTLWVVTGVLIAYLVLLLWGMKKDKLDKIEYSSKFKHELYVKTGLCIDSVIEKNELNDTNISQQVIKNQSFIENQAILTKTELLRLTLIHSHPLLTIVKIYSPLLSRISRTIIHFSKLLLIYLIITVLFAYKRVQVLYSHFKYIYQPSSLWPLL